MSDELTKTTEAQHDPTQWLRDVIITQRKTIDQQLEDIHSKNNLIVHLQNEIARLINESAEKSASVAR